MRALPDCSEQALRGFGPFADLSSQTLALLSFGARAQRLPRGGRLWRSGRPANEIFLVLRGLVSIHQAGSLQGKVVVDFGGPGDAIGQGCEALPCVHGASASVASAQAHLLAVETRALADAMAYDPALRRALAGRAARGPSALERKLRVVSAGPPVARLAAALLDLAARYGRGGDGGSIVLPFAPPAFELAAFAGVPRTLAAEQVERWASRDVLYYYDEALVIAAPRELEGVVRDGRGECRRRAGQGAIVVPIGRAVLAPPAARPSTAFALARCGR